MDFYEFATTRDLMRRRGEDTHDRGAFYRDKFFEAVYRVGSKNCAAQVMSEHMWERDRRPYYNVYPGIAPMLLRLNLDCDTSAMKPPMPVFCVRLPKQRPPLAYTFEGEPWHIRSILVGPTDLQRDGMRFDGLTLWLDTGESQLLPDGKEYPVYTYINLPLKAGMSLEEALDKLPWESSAYTGMVIPGEIRVACVKLACTICLLENDPSLIEPDVLGKDRVKYDRGPDPAIVERAKRRGKVGWNIGRQIEMVPHIRRPHLATVWTQKGRTVPKIVMRKGSVVHRDAVRKVPTGFQGNN